MSKDNDGGQAFPGVEIPAGGIPGMSLLDYFAAKALPAVYAANAKNGNYGHDENAREAYDLADAMLKAREA